MGTSPLSADEQTALPSSSLYLSLGVDSKDEPQQQQQQAKRDVLDVDSLQFESDDQDVKQAASGWNHRFQSLLERAENSPEAQFAKYQALARLSIDFVEAAKTYGRVVVSEMFLAPHLRTIPTIGIGGTAGGDKYLVRRPLQQCELHES